VPHDIALQVAGVLAQPHGVIDEERNRQLPGNIAQIIDLRCLSERNPIP